MSVIPSDLTVSDFFCGAGGNTIGARRAGLRVRLGLNHDPIAIETYGRNNADVDIVERVDLSLCDPRRYPSTDLGIFSPECTTHSPAGGNRRAAFGAGAQRDLFAPKGEDPSVQRSRVTMFDVIRFTEYHGYRLVIVENVVEVTRWPLFPGWLHMMHDLGYAHRVLSLNSMFFHPTPQSRDRIYVVFWRKGNRAPQLDYRPLAPCARCGAVEACQAWKNGRTVGKYRRQYVYACPTCGGEVTPYYFAALNAIDFSVPAERIGDRAKPLRPRTMERIAYGLAKYGRQELVVNVKQGERDASRAWPAATRELGSVPTWDDYFGVSAPGPFLVNGYGTSGEGGLTPEKRVRGVDAPHFTQAASGSHDALVTAAPFVTSAGSRDSDAPGFAPLPTQTASERLGVVQLPGFLVNTRQISGVSHRVRGPLDPMGTQTADHEGGVLGLPPGYLVETSRTNAPHRRPVDLTSEPMPAQSTQPSSALVMPYLVTLRTHADARSAADPLPAMCAGGEHHGVVTPFVVTQRAENRAKGLDAPLAPMCTGSHHMVVQGAAQMTLRDADQMHVGDLSEPLRPQLAAGPHSALLSPSPFLVSYYGNDQASASGNAVPTCTALERHALVEPAPTMMSTEKHAVVRPGFDDLRVEDCYFRMLQPHEIGIAMAFPSTYVVTGNKRQRVKQYGNAVTPPVMDWIVRQCAATLAPELAP